MKKIIFTIFSILVIGLFSFSARAQMAEGAMMNDDHTAREEAEGRAVWEKFQAKEISCATLTDDNFAVLGEYFMGTMMGDAHSAMNAMMMRMHGEEGEEQIHIVLGKRLSGCDTAAVVSGVGGGWMPMMNMMTGGWSSSVGGNQSNNPMMWNTSTWMGWGFGLGALGLLFMALWWALIIAALVALTKWLLNQFRGGGVFQKSALDILKERYAEGEISKQEFEEKKKEIA
jgi:putative membrane protein